MTKTDGLANAEPVGKPGESTHPTIREQAEKRLADLRRDITELEVRTSALGRTIVEMTQAGEDTTGAELRFADSMDRLMDLRLDEGALRFLSLPRPIE